MPFATTKKKIKNLADEVNLDFYQPKKVLAEYGYTQNRLADELGISPASLNGIVNGNPSIAQVMVMAEAIGCSFFDFFNCPIDRKEQELRERFMDAQANNPAVQLENLIKMVASLREIIMLSIEESQKMLQSLYAEDQSTQKVLMRVVEDNTKFREKMEATIKLALTSMESMNALVPHDETDGKAQS